jgi:hypothetical protein
MLSSACNLAERADPGDRDQQLQLTNRDFLPPYFAGDRTPLDPARTISQATTSGAGTNCTRVGDHIGQLCGIF